MSYDLNGSTQYLTSATGLVPKDVASFSMWICPDFASSGTTLMYPMDTTTASYSIRKTATTNQCGVYADSRTATFTPSRSWPAGAWIHMAYCLKKTGNVLQLWLDGVSQTLSASGTWGSNTPSALRLGATAAGASFFDGKICCVGMWSIVLSPSDIGLLYRGTCPISVQRTALVEYWPLVDNLNGALGSNLTATGSPTVGAHSPYCRQNMDFNQILQAVYDPVTKSLRTI